MSAPVKKFSPFLENFFPQKWEVTIFFRSAERWKLIKNILYLFMLMMSGGARVGSRFLLRIFRSAARDFKIALAVSDLRVSLRLAGAGNAASIYLSISTALFCAHICKNIENRIRLSNGRQFSTAGKKRLKFVVLFIFVIRSFSCFTERSFFDPLFSSLAV